MMKMRKVLAAVLALTLACGAVYAPAHGIADTGITASAATIVESGTWSNGMKWELDSNGVFTVTGKGEMPDFDVAVNDSIERKWKEGYLCNTKVKKIVVGKGVTSVGRGSFAWFYGLESVVLPDSVTKIDDTAFSNDFALNSVIIPDSVEYIGEAAFQGAAFKTFTMPGKLKTIAIGAFDTSRLVSVYIPNTVTSIDELAFALCDDLEVITITNPECDIFDSDETIFNYCDDADKPHFNGVIRGYAGSTAQAYAGKYGYSFLTLGKKVSYGDPTGDGRIDSSDATFCLVEYASLATGGTSIMTAEEKAAADVNKDSAVDSKDASAILSYYSYTATGGTDSIEDHLFPKT